VSSRRQKRFQSVPCRKHDHIEAISVYVPSRTTHSTCFTFDVETQLLGLPEIGLGQPEIPLLCFEELAIAASSSAQEFFGAAVETSNAVVADKNAALSRDPELSADAFSANPFASLCLFAGVKPEDPLKNAKARSNLISNILCLRLRSKTREKMLEMC